jgi:hypothetical protein
VLKKLLGESGKGRTDIVALCNAPAPERRASIGALIGMSHEIIALAYSSNLPSLNMGWLQFSSPCVVVTENHWKMFHAGQIIRMLLGFTQHGRSPPSVT